MCIIRPIDTLIRLDRPLWQGGDINDWLARQDIEPTASIVNMMLMSGGILKSDKTVFTYTGAAQFYTVPWGVHRLFVKLWGAGGGGSQDSTDVRGGACGFVSGILQVEPGETLEIIVGQGGAWQGTARTFGGGGADTGGVEAGANAGASGGGRSAIRRTGADLVTAGGGGGGCNNSVSGRFAGAGGPIGGNGTAANSPGASGQTATGGTQVGGGVAFPTATAGTAGQGGDGGQVSTYYGGGGGGGKYGGGGGVGYGGGGGGSNDADHLEGTVINEAGVNGTPPQTGDGDYSAGIGQGGTYGVNSTGGNGRVVITTIP